MKFRDRPLRDGEHSHWVCENCGQELTPDGRAYHRCNKKS